MSATTPVTNIRRLGIRVNNQGGTSASPVPSQNNKISVDRIWGPAKRYINNPNVGTKHTLEQINELTKIIDQVY